MITFTESILLLLSVIILFAQKSHIQDLFTSKNEIDVDIEKLESDIKDFRSLVGETFYNLSFSLAGVIPLGLYVIFYLLSITYINSLIFNIMSTILILIVLITNILTIKHIDTDLNIIESKNKILRTIFEIYVDIIDNTFCKITSIVIDIVYVVYIVYHVLVRIIYN